MKFATEAPEVRLQHSLRISGPFVCRLLKNFGERIEKVNKWAKLDNFFVDC